MRYSPVRGPPSAVSAMALLCNSQELIAGTR